MDVRDYTEKYAAQYRGDGPGWFERTLVEVRRRQVIASIERYPHRRVLEVGCGLEPLFAYWNGFEALTVVEPSPDFVAHARAQAAGRPDVRVIEGLLEDVADALCPEGAPPLDFVVASSLLHEVPDPVRLLAVLRSLAGDAVLHLNVPNVYSFHRLLALEMGLIRDLFEPSEMERRFGRTTRFDRAALVRMLEGAGFAVLRFGTYFVKPLSHAQMEQLFDQGILPREALAGFEGMARHLPDMGAEMYAEVRAC